MSRRLGTDDYVYRVIDPEHRDENGPMAIEFEDPDRNYESLSFFVASVATPRMARCSREVFPRKRNMSYGAIGAILWTNVRSRLQGRPNPREFHPESNLHDQFLRPTDLDKNGAGGGL